MVDRRRDETELLFQAAHLWVRRYYPGLTIEDFRLKLSNGRTARLPLPELLECVEVLRNLPDDVDPDTILSPPPSSAHRAGGMAERPGRGEATHTRDFATVNWYGKIYSFTGMQRAIVAHLWEAMESGVPAVSQECLLESVDSKSKKLYELFKRNPAWGVLVVPGWEHGHGIGTYMLAPPPTPSESVA